MQNYEELTENYKKYRSLEYIIKQIKDHAYPCICYSNENLYYIDDIDEELRKIVLKHYNEKLDKIKKEIDKFKIVKE